MSGAPSDTALFAALVEALRPALAEIVVVGGWAQRLFRLHDKAVSRTGSPLMTLDVDVALGESRPSGEVDLAKRLHAGGFSAELRGDHRPPVARYRPTAGGGFYVEFLTPLRGGGEKRSGARDVTCEIAGVSAQKLRYLDILLVAPISVELQPSERFPLSERALVRLPNPASYIAQKLLIHGKRTRAGKAKDIAYLFDAVEIFGEGLASFGTTWIDEVEPTLHANARKRLARAGDDLFGAVTDDIREAAAVLGDAGRSVEAETIRSVCREGLRRIFG